MILVTGCAGFIGSHLVDELLKSREVVGIDNFNDYYDPEIKRRNISDALKNSNFTLYEEDITNAHAMEKIFKSHRIESVVHLAARAGVRASLEDPLLYQKVNVEGTIILLEMARKFSVKKFIFGSSSSVYGGAEPPYTEESATTPVSPYGASKKSAEIFCKTYHDLYGLSVACLRFFTVYGPRGRPDMAPYLFTKSIHEGSEITQFGNGSSERDYTFVSDIIAGITLALEKNLSFEIINLGGSNPVTLQDFIATVEKKVGKAAKIKIVDMQQGDMKATCADITKAHEILGWAPHISLDEGLEKFVAWYTKRVA